MTEEMITNMICEGSERLGRMKASTSDRSDFLFNRKITKVVVNHDEQTVRKDEISDEEMKLIKELEEEKNIVVYYMIQDEGLWPDGESFKRLTLLHVDSYEDDYPFVHDECIGRCKTVPAYVINLDEPGCSETTEIAFRTIQGLIINAS